MSRQKSMDELKKAVADAAAENEIAKAGERFDAEPDPESIAAAKKLHDALMEYEEAKP